MMAKLSVFSGRVRQQVFQPVIGFAAALIGLIWLATQHQVSIERTALQRDIAQDASNIAAVLELNVARIAGDLDRILKFLRQSHERNGFKGDWASLVKETYTVGKQAVQIAVIDARGTMITSTAMLYPKTPVDLSDREHFRKLVETNADELVISRPVIGRASGKWSVQFARRFTDAEGKFAGVLVISLDPQGLSRSYGKLNLGEGGGIAVIGADDVIRAGTGIYQDKLGHGLQDAIHYGEDDTVINGTQLVIASVAGGKRRVAIRQVDGYPLFVLVAGRDVATDATRLKNRSTYFLAGTFLTILVLLAMAVSLRNRKLQESVLLHLAHHDQLTSLPNRTAFREAIDRAYSAGLEGKRFALHLIDLDGFKFINDTHGHAIGDRLLKSVAERLSAILRHCDFPARLGGDEFAVIQNAIADGGEAEALASRICARLSQPYEIDDLKLVIGASIGIALGPTDRDASVTLMKGADLALYAVKAKGRGTYRFYDKEMDSAAQARHALENDLRLALAHEQLELHYQPIVHLRTREVLGYEALVRWRHPEQGLIYPADFILVAEESGLIIPLGEWVLRSACKEMAKHPAPLRVAVNLSALQFRTASLSALIEDALARSGLEAERLEIEITESVLMQRDSTTLAQLDRLRALGIQISLDNFGTGYSSLSYLQTYPVQCIKIDRSFVKALETSDTAAPIIRAITALASCLLMKTVAEGVETQGQLDLLKSVGVSEVQGFLFGIPRPASEIWPANQQAQRAA